MGGILTDMRHLFHFNLNNVNETNSVCSWSKAENRVCSYETSLIYANAKPRYVVHSFVTMSSLSSGSVILNTYSIFSWTIHPRGRGCNEVIPMWSSKPGQQDQTTSPGTTFMLIMLMLWASSVSKEANSDTNCRWWNRSKKTFCVANWLFNLFISVVLMMQVKLRQCLAPGNKVY